MAMPTKDTLLVAWGSNFDTKVTLSPVTYALSAAQATAFHAVYIAFVTAYNAVATAREAGTRSTTLTSTKDAAKGTLLLTGRELYGVVQDSNSVSHANKLDVGVTPRKTTPTPIPAPAAAPGLDVVGVSGWTVKIRLHDTAGGAKRGKPLGVSGAAVFSYVGAAAPTDITAWQFEGNTGRPVVDVVFPDATAAGARVWLTAFWFNPRKQSGPACAPVATNVQGGGVSTIAA